MKIQTLYVILALCLGIASATMGQVPYTRPDTFNMSHNIAPMTPDRLAKIQQTAQLGYAAATDLHLGNYAQAEAEARESLFINSMNGGSAEVLAAALEGQNKDKEALEAYRVMVVDEKAEYPRVLLPYAQLLLKSGQWAQALTIYNEVLLHLPDVGPHPETPIVHDGDQIRANSHFSSDVPEPAALAVALHIARGMVYNTTGGWAGDSQNTEAMAEYGKALQLAPENTLANYYYGVGWHNLSLAERVKFGHADQAKAALQKAALLGSTSVKKMAEETLKKSN